MDVVVGLFCMFVVVVVGDGLDVCCGFYLYAEHIYLVNLF